MHNEHIHPPEPGKPKNTTQMISLIVGFALFVIGLAGQLSSSFAGLHFTILHGLIISACGALLMYNGYKDDSWKAFLSCIGFGLFFGVYSLIGFLLGEPGTPTIGFMKPDPYYISIIPGFQEFGRSDHILNGIISIVLLGGAFDWFGKHSGRSVKRRISPGFQHRRRHA